VLLIDMDPFVRDLEQRVSETAVESVASLTDTIDTLTEDAFEVIGRDQIGERANGGRLDPGVHRAVTAAWIWSRRSRTERGARGRTRASGRVFPAHSGRMSKTICPGARSAIPLRPMASTRGIAPKDVNDEVIGELIAAVREQSLCPRPTVLHRKITQIWNEAARDPALGLRRVAVPPYRAPKRIVLAAVRAAGFLSVKDKSPGNPVLSPTWIDLFARLSGRRAHIGLSRRSPTDLAGQARSGARVQTATMRRSYQSAHQRLACRLASR
jgi:hypothetical protein